MRQAGENRLPLGVSGGCEAGRFLRLLFVPPPAAIRHATFYATFTPPLQSEHFV